VMRKKTPYIAAIPNEPKPVALYAEKR
jgi:hypothetical protein